MAYDRNKEYRLFISHCWDYKGNYYKIEEWIDDSDINWKNMSIPVHDPKDTSTDSELKTKIENNIKGSSLFIVIAGMYVARENRYWINFEIDTALKYGKNILAIKPRGNERLPEKIQDNADLLVNWNSTSIIGGIKDLL